jgi:hypothetical protein
MRAHTLIPSFEDLYLSSPLEIKKYIDDSKNIPQSSTWHPEAPNARVPHNVYAHTRIVFDRAYACKDINLVLSAFFHDLGKNDTTAINKKGEWGAHGHEIFSTKLVEKNASWIENFGADAEKVKEIVENHMRIKQISEMRPSKKEIIFNLSTYKELQIFTKCDDMRTLTNEELIRYNNT